MSTNNNKTSNQSPPDGTRQRIIQAAAEIISQRGYARGTTHAIAEAAGVNEVTIFRHFGSKKNLFMTIIDQYGVPALAPSLEAQFSGELRQDLLLIGNTLMRIMLESRANIRLLLCESIHFPEMRNIMVKNPRQLRLMLSRYFQHQIEQGHLRNLHPESLARVFSGMFFSYAITNTILNETQELEMSSEQLAAQFVDIFLNGVIQKDI